MSEHSIISKIMDVMAEASTRTGPFSRTWTCCGALTEDSKGEKVRRLCVAEAKSLGNGYYAGLCDSCHAVEQDWRARIASGEFKPKSEGGGRKYGGVVAEPPRTMRNRWEKR